MAVERGSAGRSLLELALLAAAGAELDDVPAISQHGHGAAADVAPTRARSLPVGAADAGGGSAVAASVEAAPRDRGPDAATWRAARLARIRDGRLF